MLLGRITSQGLVDVCEGSGEVFHQDWASRGLATGDLDNDGRVDAVVTTNGGPVHILQNETDARFHWLGLHLIRHKSNSDAIGGSVRMITSQGAQYETGTTAGMNLCSSGHSCKLFPGGPI